MSAVDAIKRKLEELERKGLLEQFLFDYQYKTLNYVIREYHINRLNFCEVRKYIEDNYNIKHINQKRLR